MGNLSRRALKYPHFLEIDDMQLDSFCGLEIIPEKYLKQGTAKIATAIRGAVIAHEIKWKKMNSLSLRDLYLTPDDMVQIFQALVFTFNQGGFHLRSLVYLIPFIGPFFVIPLNFSFLLSCFLSFFSFLFLVWMRWNWSLSRVGALFQTKS